VHKENYLSNSRRRVSEEYTHGVVEHYVEESQQEPFEGSRRAKTLERLSEYEI
jgi:hypothetical protein